MEVVNPLKETILLGILNIGLPTADVYSDIALTARLYTATITTTDWTYDHYNGTWTSTSTTSIGHPIYATCLLIPFLVNYALGWRTWYFSDMKNHHQRKKFTWILALLGCYPQLLAARVIWLFWKQPGKASRKKKELERNVIENEVFTEAVPSTLIVTVLMVVLVIQSRPDPECQHQSCKNARILVAGYGEGDGYGKYLFFTTFATSVLSAGLGLAKCLKVRSFKMKHPTIIYQSSILLFSFSIKSIM